MADPKAVASLDTAWILIAGLPDIASSERVIQNMSRLLGKVVVVDQLSLRKEVEVRVRTKCLDSNRLRSTVRVYFNDQGFDLKISPKPTNHIGRPRYSDDGHFGGCHGEMATTMVVAVATAQTTMRKTTTPTAAARLLGTLLSPVGAPLGAGPPGQPHRPTPSLSLSLLRLWPPSLPRAPRCHLVATSLR
ncbi:hypothetical protein D1007_30516 [Hordeum vulgare]|nr:hypothetical protein D1007_30516 [Hordeum vulgare]